MACHAIKFCASPEAPALGQPSREEREAQLLAAFGAALEEQSQPATTVAPEPGSGQPEYVMGVRRANLAVDLAQLLDAIEGALGDRAWYRIAYHLCRNEEFLPCEPWQVVRRKGTAPEEL